MKLILACFSLILIHFRLTAQQTNAIIYKGNQYYQQSEFDVAEIQYRKALAKEPSNITAKYNLANALHHQKKYDETIQALTEILSTSNGEIKSLAYYNQGVTYTKNKDLEKSIEAYKNALRIDPSDSMSRDNLEKALLELKKQQQQKKNQDKQNQQQPKMSQKDAEQKLKLLEQKEKNLQQRIQSQARQAGKPQVKDW